MRVAVDAEAVPEGLQENLQIEAEAPALDVVEVTLDPPLDRRVAPPSVDLGPARDPRLHLVAEHVARHPAPELLHEARALRARPDEAHLAPEHVEELRQLVEARAPEEDAERRAAWIIRARPDGPGLLLGVHAHRPELQHLEASACGSAMNTMSTCWRSSTVRTSSMPPSQRTFSGTSFLSLKSPSTKMPTSRRRLRTRSTSAAGSPPPTTIA